MLHFKKELKALIREYEAKGWTVTKTPSGSKIKWTPPFASDHIVITADYATDMHAIENTRKRLEKIKEGF